LAVILNAHFKVNDFQPAPQLKFRTKLLIFTALLICMENTFWDLSRLENGKFVELFQNSFMLYVESGMVKMVERDIDILKIEQGEVLVKDYRNFKDFKAKFYKFIVDHYLPIPGESRARASGESASGESTGGEYRAIEERASGEPHRASTSGGHGWALELEQKSKKKVTWLRNLMPKFHRGQRG